MKSLKILFVIDSLGTGGAERDLAERLPWLSHHDIVPIVASLRRRQEGVQRDIELQGFDVRFLNSGFVSRILALRRIIRAEQIDLVHTVLFHSDIVGRLAAAGTQTKVLSSLVNVDYDKVRLNDPNIRAIRFRLARLIDSWTARHLTDHIHANSNAVKTAAVRDLRIPAEKITMIEQGREPNRLGRPSAERRRRVRLQLGLQEDHQVLVNVGRQDFQKGQRYLLEAMARLTPANPRLVLLVAGRPGNVSRELDHLRDQLGLRERVLFLGHRDDVPDILAAGDLFVFPSLHEGLPGAVIEAMALGLPIIASSIDPVRETVEEGRNAILIGPDSPVELAAAIERLLEDRETAHAFGQRSREIFEERFTFDRSMVRKIELYRQVLSLSCETWKEVET